MTQQAQLTETITLHTFFQILDCTALRVVSAMVEKLPNGSRKLIPIVMKISSSRNMKDSKNLRDKYGTT